MEGELVGGLGGGLRAGGEDGVVAAPVGVGVVVVDDFLVVEVAEAGDGGEGLFGEGAEPLVEAGIVVVFVAGVVVGEAGERVADGGGGQDDCGVR